MKAPAMDGAHLAAGRAAPRWRIGAVVSLTFRILLFISAMLGALAVTGLSEPPRVASILHQGTPR